MSWITWVILGETHQLTSVTQCSWHMPHSMSEGDLKTIRGWMNCKGTGRPLSWQEVKHEKLYWLTQDLKEEIFISSVHSADTQKCQVLIKKKKKKYAILTQKKYATQTQEKYAALRGKKVCNTDYLPVGSFSRNFSRTLISSLAASRYFSTFLMILRAVASPFLQHKHNGNHE